jgi:signal transduction histidine kinase/ActR/RegA family two-component response regulator
MANESILIADDEPDVLDLCQRILTAEGYRVEAVQTGYEALERIRHDFFDLLLTDIKMPGMNGLEIAQAVKETYPGITCVIMTGYSTVDTAIEALRLGVDDFVLKPFAPEDLSMSIAKALEKDRLHKENIRLRSLIPLFEFNRTLLSTVEVDTLLHQVLRLAQEETQADLGILFLGKGKEIREHMDPAPQEKDEDAQSPRLELAKWIMQHQEFLSLRRGEPAPEQFETLLEALDVEFLVGLPLVAKEGQSLGALVLGKRSEPFASGDGEFLQVMGGQAATAIENAHLFQEIQQAYDELKELDHLKSEFINIAAHELRTPLAILLGYASVMAEEVISEVNRGRLDVIIRNAMRLSSLIDDMLNLSYLESGQAQLEIEEIELREVIQEAILDTRDMAREKSLDIKLDMPVDFPPLMTDQKKLDLIVMNLLSNAIKYTPEEGHISIKAWVDGDKALVAVSDSGIGIPPEERDRIFDRFYQVEDSLTRQHGGIGLGLAIVKSFVELCQGQIWVESEVGKGSTFTFDLPLRPSL